MVAPGGTVAVAVVAFTTANVVAVLCLKKLMPVAPVKLVPVRVTLVPTGPLVGDRLARVGAGITVKATPLLVPPGVVIVTLPVVVPGGTVAVAVVAFTTANVVAAVPLKLMPVAPLRVVPVRVTLVPTGPLLGDRLVRMGAAGVVFNSTSRVLWL